MTAKKGDLVFVVSGSFYHDELPGILMTWPSIADGADVLVLPSGHNPFTMKLKEFQYSDEKEGFYLIENLPYPNRPVEEPVHADAPQELSEGSEPESDGEGNGSELVSSSEEEDEDQEGDGEGEQAEEPEEVDESEADEEASEDGDEPDSEPPVAKTRTRAPVRRKR